MQTRKPAGFAILPDTSATARRQMAKAARRRRDAARMASIERDAMEQAIEYTALCKAAREWDWVTAEPGENRLAIVAAICGMEGIL